jgi:CrcB protein
MRKYILIGAGGILGAILRYLLKGVQIYHYHENVPLNTFLINITGSFILAVVLTVAFEVWEFDANIRLGIATGFLGAFTTFSTLCRETVELVRRGDYFSAVTYVAVSVMIGMAAIYFGIVLAREAVAKLVKKYRGGSGEDSSGQTGNEAG